MRNSRAEDWRSRKVLLSTTIQHSRSRKRVMCILDAVEELYILSKDKAYIKQREIIKNLLFERHRHRDIFLI